jgi:hypothetical protein
MRRGPGRAVETTTQRENETTKLESSSVRVDHASEGQVAGWTEAMSIFGLCSVLPFAYSPVFKRNIFGRDTSEQVHQACVSKSNNPGRNFVQD